MNDEFETQPSAPDENDGALSGGNASEPASEPQPLDADGQPFPVPTTEPDPDATPATEDETPPADEEPEVEQDAEPAAPVSGAGDPPHATPQLPDAHNPDADAAMQAKLDEQHAENVAAAEQQRSDWGVPPVQYPEPSA